MYAVGVAVADAEPDVADDTLDEREDPIDKLVTCGSDKDEDTEPKLLEAIPVEPNEDEAETVELTI